MKEGGWLYTYTPDGVVERPTHTCAHCQSVVQAESARSFHEVADFCRKCMKVVCAGCAAGDCDPIEKKLERIEAQWRFRESLRLG